jgi:hypothetical protein
MCSTFVHHLAEKNRQKKAVDLMNQRHFKDLVVIGGLEPPTSAL